MGTSSSAASLRWYPAWWGLAIGLCLFLPTLLRIQREPWTEFNTLLGVAGMGLVIFCLTTLVVILRRAKRESAKAEAEGPGAP